MKDFLQNILLILSVIVLAASCYNEDNRIIESCADEIMNQDETGVDCGGTICNPCPPSCDNGILDWVDGWQEVGIDCGGPCAELGQLCCENGIQDINENDITLSENWVDCKFDGLGPGDAGSNSECPICPTCENGLPDPGETVTIDGVVVQAIDCDDDPNTDCPLCDELCDDGLLNGLEMPCLDCGGVCLNCNDSHCFNGVQDTYPNDPNKNETAIDCGGCDCAPCSTLCGDGILNGSEVAIDCGGNDCVPCIDGSLCGDGVLNGYETAIDCYDGTDGASSCPPCSVVCNDVIQNGNETDTDCGGPVCGPCGNEEVGFLTYMVDGVLYESVFTSMVCTRLPGNITNPLDGINLSGGVNHQISFTIFDYDEATPAPDQWNTDVNVINNISLTSQNEASFVDNDGQGYAAHTDGTGITLTITDIEYVAPLPPPNTLPGGVIEGTFSGRFFNSADGTYKNISGGAFRAFFTN